MQLFTLENPTSLERNICCLLNTPDNLAQWNTFPSGEKLVNIHKPDPNCALIARLYPPHHNITSTLLLLDTLVRNGAQDITVIAPYTGYARQDRVINKGDSLAVAWLLRQLKSAGASRLIATAIHNPDIINHSPIPIIDLHLYKRVADRLNILMKNQSATIIAPDQGSRHRADGLSAHLTFPHSVGWIEKTRSNYGVANAVAYHHSSPSYPTAILTDDIIDTGVTIQEAINLLRQHGFSRFFLVVTHALFSKRAVSIISNLPLDALILSDTYPLKSQVRKLPNCIIISAAPTLASAVRERVCDIHDKIST